MFAQTLQRMCVGSASMITANVGTDDGTPRCWFSLTASGWKAKIHGLRSQLTSQTISAKILTAPGLLLGMSFPELAQVRESCDIVNNFNDKFSYFRR